jgi:hypothetical protein
VANDDLDLDLDGDDSNDGGDTGNGMKALRAQIKKLAKEKADQDTELAQFRKQVRSGSIVEFLNEHGASPKLAKYAAADIDGDVTKESVLAWLKSDGDAFGWQEEPGDSSADSDTANQARRISQATSGAPEAQTGLTVEMIQGMDFDALIKNGIVKAN